MSAGQLVGERVVPYPAVAVPVPTVSARAAMVEALLAYVGALSFRRPGPQGESFTIKPRNLLDEWPDPEQRLEYPTIAVPPTPGEYQVVGLTPAVDESSFGVYAPGCALVHLHEYVETLQVTLWAAGTGDRQAMIARLEAELGPHEDKSGLRVTTNYFDRVACFSLLSSTLDDAEAVRGSRRADLMVVGRIPVVRLSPFRRAVVGVRVEPVEPGEDLETDVAVPT